MTNTADAPPKPRKSLLMPLLAGVVLAVGLGGAAFWIARGGLAGGDSAHVASGPTPTTYAYVALNPITINLGSRADSRHLRVTVQLEVAPAHHDEVQRLGPRILDVLNVYLRALSLADLEEASAMIRLRAQMLRRVQIVTGPGRVNELLITEFLFN